MTSVVCIFTSVSAVVGPQRGAGCGLGADKVIEQKAQRQEEEDVCRAKSQVVSAACSESEETELLKGPASTGLIRKDGKQLTSQPAGLQPGTTDSHDRKHKLAHCI